MRRQYFPKDVIEFVGKTGFISKEVWGQFFFVGGTKAWKHASWSNLKSRGYLVPHAQKHLRNVYVLGRSNREVLACLGGKPALPPPAAQIDHDEILSVGLLTAQRSGEIAGWTSESELKASASGANRIEAEGQPIKYSDAVLECESDGKRIRIAVELELTVKSSRRYVQILGAYAAMGGIDAVLYICRDPSIERTIMDTAAQVYFPFEDVTLKCSPLKAWQQNPVSVIKGVIQELPGAPRKYS